MAMSFLSFLVFIQDWVELGLLEHLWFLSILRFLLGATTIIASFTVLFDLTLILLLALFRLLLALIILIIIYDVLNVSLVMHPILFDGGVRSLLDEAALSQCGSPQELVHLVLQFLIKWAQRLEEGLEVQKSLYDRVGRH